LTLLEQKHGLSSTEFYERCQRGEMGDEMEIKRWATKFEMYEEIIERRHVLRVIFRAVRSSVLGRGLPSGVLVAAVSVAIVDAVG
jgi:hypothetical protein